MIDLGSGKVGGQGRSRRGFSLLELVIACSIALVLMGVVVQLLHGTRRNMSASANSFQAINLSAKIIGDLSEETRVQADFLGAFHRFSEMGTKDPVIEGSSLYFRYFKDREAPFGKIDLSREGGIRPEDGAPFEQLRSFEAQVQAERQSPTDSSDWSRHIAASEIRITWKEMDGRDVSYQIPILVSSPIGPRPQEGLEMDEAKLDREMVSFLFPGTSGSTFEKACRDNGCNLEFARAVARIGVLTDSGTQGLASLSAEIDDLNRSARSRLAAPDVQLITLQRRLTRRADAGVSLVYQVLVALLDDLTLIRTRANATMLAPIPFPPFRKALQSFTQLAGNLYPWLDLARVSYNWLLQDSLQLLVSHRDREFALSKTLDALRLQLALGKVEPRVMREFIDRGISQNEGRNPSLERAFLLEKETSLDATSLRRNFPMIGQVCSKLADPVQPFLQEVPALILKHPRSGRGQ